MTTTETDKLFSKVYKPPTAVEGDAKANDEDLSRFLEEGGCKTESWDSDALFQLGSELRDGSATLGYDNDGKVVRVVSVAKPVVFDGSNVLIEAFQSFPPKSNGEIKKPKVKCTGISEKFNPLMESPCNACVRALKEELKVTLVSTSDFEGIPAHREVVAAASKKFAGLASEYHLYYCALARKACLELQKTNLWGGLPLDEMTPVAETEGATNPKTMWWAWCPDEEPGAIELVLEKLTAETEFANLIDYRTKVKLGTPGEQVRADIEVIKKMEAAR